MKNLTIFLASSFLFLVSCSYTGTQQQVKLHHKEHSVNLSSSFYLIYPKNGLKQGFTAKMKENPKSATEVVATLKEYFVENGSTLAVSSKNIELDDGFKKAKQNGSEYLMKVDINQWQDVYYGSCRGAGMHKHQISSLDTADVTLYIYNVETQKLLNKQKLSSKGCPTVLLSLIPLGMNNPEARLKSLLPEWIGNTR